MIFRKIREIFIEEYWSASIERNFRQKNKTIEERRKQIDLSYPRNVKVN